MSVVAAFELDDFVAPGKSTREANCTHGGFSAGTGHAHQVDIRHQLADALCQFNLERRWRAKTQSFLRGCGNRGDDFRVGMTANHRTPGAHIVDIALTIDVDQVSALGTIDKRWGATYGVEGAYR